MALVTTAPAPRVLADVIPKSKLNDLILIGLGAAVIGLAAQIAITNSYLSASAVTLQTLAVLFTGAMLGAMRGAAAVTLYAALALAGTPWLAAGTTGFTAEGALAPTFGYLIGFIAAAAVVGYLAESGWTRKPIDTALAMILGGTVIYAGGVLWLHFAAGASWNQSIYLGMTVFLLSDVIKIAIAAVLFPLAWKQLVKAGLASAEHINRTKYLDSTDETESGELDQSALLEPDSDDENVIDLTKSEAGQGEAVVDVTAQDDAEATLDSDSVVDSNA